MRKQMAGRLQEHVSAPASDFAVKQLQKMGWTAGTGLGRKRDGMVSHIKVKKRVENAGLGTERQAAEQQQTAETWWKDSLGDTLAKLASKNGRKKRKKTFTDEELFEATGGARFGTKGGKLRSAKWQRTESNTSLDENKAELPEDVDKKHTAIPADKLFKEEALNEGPPEVASDSSVKKKSKKDKKKKKKSKKDKKEKCEKKKPKIVKDEE